MMMTPKEKMQALYQMNFDGNIIPHRWYSSITFDNGKPQLNAIIILAEIVYWYRPKLLKEEHTGQVVGLAKRFKADLLQRSYDSFAEQFGLSKKQVKDAILKLESLEIITRVFRNIDTPQGQMSNVLFIDLHPDKLRVHTYGLISPHPPTSKDTPPPIEVQTYTETTPETTPEIKAPTQKTDYLQSVINGQGKVNESTAPNPDDQWFEYSDRFVQEFNNRLGRYPKLPEKEEIIAWSTGLNASLDKWIEAINDAVNHHPHGSPNLQRITEIYDHYVNEKGDYETFAATKWGDKDHSNGKPKKSLDDYEKIYDMDGNWTGGYYGIKNV